MALIVAKFGGSSVADAESIRRVAKRVAYMKARGNQVVVVVSAMGDSTDELIDLADDVLRKTEPPAREMDILLSAGERISMALLSMAVGSLGVRARSFTGPQAGLLTTADYGQARITDVQPERVVTALEEDCVAIVAGFQGFNKTGFETTTLGRGGSDTTAVALAAALNADVCEIYTDVDGVFSADPRVVPAARPIDAIGYEEMLELAAHGAKILHLRAVEFARRHGVKLQVRSSFSALPGTLVCSTEAAKEAGMEDAIISGLATDSSPAKITLVGLADQPGTAAAVFDAVADAGVNVDMVVQNISSAGDGLTDISFTVDESRVAALSPVLRELQRKLAIQLVRFNESVGTLSVVGAGIRSHPGVASRVFAALGEAGINIEMISASEVRISVVVAQDDLARAARVVHTAFGLDSQSGEAVVHAGTGR